MDSSKLTYTYIVSTYCGRIICRSYQHTRKKAATCRKKCQRFCPQCGTTSKYLTYYYQCGECQRTFCCIHYQTFATHTPDHTVLTCEHVAKLTCWLQKSFTFKIIFRASRDGYTSGSFHDKCDGMAPTITIVRNNYNKVFGGYTPIMWDSKTGEVTDPSEKSFIFSMSQNKKYKLVSKEVYAILCFPYYGPAFGNWSFNLGQTNQGNCKELDSCRADFHLFKGQDYEAESFENFIGSNDGRFSVIDYEVLLLCK